MTRGYVVSISILAGDLGRLLPLHQGRRRRRRAGADDVLPRRARRPPARAVRARHARRAPGPRRAALRGEAGPRARDINAAIPFTLIALGEKYIDSGVAAVANATVPLFVVLLAIRFRPSERARGSRLAGILLGLAGVALLAGAQPGGRLGEVAGTLLVVLASFSYAAARCTARRAATRSPARCSPPRRHRPRRSCCCRSPSSRRRTTLPSWEAIASIVALGVAGTALAQLILFRMFRLYGASRTTLVTYLMPPTALLYGMLFLDEPLTLASVGGLAVILAGVALGSGALRLPRREPAPAAPPA